jgi:hypothetical protein
MYFVQASPEIMEPIHTVKAKALLLSNDVLRTEIWKTDIHSSCRIRTRGYWRRRLPNDVWNDTDVIEDVFVYKSPHSFSSLISS